VKILVQYVQIHCIHYGVVKHYPDDQLLPARCWSMHTMDTLLSHEATQRSCEWQWSDVTDTGRSNDNDNMMNVEHPDYIHTT